MKLLIMIFWISLFSVTVYAQGSILDIDPCIPFHHGSFRSFFGLGTALNLDNYYPKLFYRFYLNDDIKDFIDGVLILGLDFNIGE